MSVKFEPLGDRVALIRAEASEKRSAGGIIMQAAPTGNKKVTTICQVVAVGPGKWVDGEFHATTLKVGDRVLVGAFVGEVAELNNVEVLITKEDGVLGRLTNIDVTINPDKAAAVEQG